jgi:hypothetical protein
VILVLNIYEMGLETSKVMKYYMECLIVIFFKFNFMSGFIRILTFQIFEKNLKFDFFEKITDIQDV